MKIALFTDVYPPQVNGVVTHILDITESFKKNHDVLIVAPRQRRAAIAKDLEKISYLLPSAPTHLYKDLRITPPFYPQLIEKISRFGPDVIHFHTPVTVGMNGILMGKMFGIPIAGSFHTYFMEPEYLKIVGLDRIRLAKTELVHKVLWMYNNLFYNRADVVICPSKTTRGDLQNHGLKKNVEVISNGINLTLFKKTDWEMFERIRLKHRIPKQYLIHVGRLSREKNIDLLIHAFSMLSKRERDVGLVLVGDGPQRRALEHLCSSLKCKKNVFFLGEMQRDRLIRSGLLHGARAFVTASTSETQGIVLLEAMAAGLPLIGVRAKAIPELVDDNGILCPPDDTACLAAAMDKITGSKDNQQKYAQRSKLLVQKHALDRTVNSLINVYQDIIRAKRAS